MITEKYRTDYDGEFVVSKAIWEGGKKREEREWVPNVITNEHISDRAIILYSMDIKENYDPARLINHRGGLLGQKKLQIYAVDNVVESIAADFAVTRDQNLLSRIIDNGYNDRTVCYTTTSNCVTYPEQFYMVPFNPGLVTEALAVYLACFDGHKEVFLYNFEKYDDQNVVKQLGTVFRTYRGTKFYLVDVADHLPSNWKGLSNVAYMNLREEWLSHCDI